MDEKSKVTKTKIDISLFWFGFWFLVFVFCLLGLHPQPMEVPKLGVESELQPPACNTAMAMHDLSHVGDLHHSSRQHWILNPLSKARDLACIRMDMSQVCNWLCHNGN